MLLKSRNDLKIKKNTLHSQPQFREIERPDGVLYENFKYCIKYSVIVFMQRQFCGKIVIREIFLENQLRVLTIWCAVHVVMKTKCKCTGLSYLSFSPNCTFSLCAHGRTLCQTVVRSSWRSIPTPLPHHRTVHPACATIPVQPRSNYFARSSCTLYIPHRYY